MLLGNTLARLLSFGGMDVKKVDIINDRGIHICKSMLAYQRRGDGAQPDCKPDHFVGKWYVRFAQEVKDDPTLEDQAQEMLRKREAGDEEVMGLRTTMTDRCLEGMAQTYDRYHTHIDRAYRESEHYSHGAQLVRDRASE
jgi:arginyl-tRNA synthetase